MKKLIWAFAILFLAACITLVFTSNGLSSSFLSSLSARPPISSDDHLVTPKTHPERGRLIPNKSINRDPIVFQGLKNLEIHNKNDSGKFEDLGELYLRNYLKDHPGVNLKSMMNSILMGVENENSRSYLLSVFFSYIKCDFQEIEELLRDVSNYTQDIDRYITAVRNNIFVISMPFDDYYTFVKSLDKISGSVAMYDEILVNKFIEETSRVDQSQIISKVDTLMNGSTQDQNIILDYIGKINFDKAEGIISDTRIEPGKAALMINRLLPQLSVTYPSRALDLLFKLKLEDTARYEMEKYLIAEWRKTDPVDVDQWISSISDISRRERLAAILNAMSSD